MAFAHVAYLVGVEWVGKFFMHPVSQPFFLGSAEHAAAVSPLKDVVLFEDDSVHVDSKTCSQWATHPFVGPVLVSWTLKETKSGKFLKIIESSAFDAAMGAQESSMNFRNLFKVYAAYQAVIESSPAVPSSLVKARLMFGQFAVLVEMPFVGSRCAVAAELQSPGAVASSIAAAVCWLAARGLLYVDLRPRNVRVPGGLSEMGSASGAYLIDYDDMVILPKSIHTVSIHSHCVGADC